METLTLYNNSNRSNGNWAVVLTQNDQRNLANMPTCDVIVRPLCFLWYISYLRIISYASCFTSLVAAVDLLWVFQSHNLQTFIQFIIHILIFLRLSLCDHFKYTFSFLIDTIILYALDKNVIPTPLVHTHLQLQEHPSYIISNQLHLHPACFYDKTTVV